MNLEVIKAAAKVVGHHAAQICKQPPRGLNMMISDGTVMRPAEDEVRFRLIRAVDQRVTSAVRRPVVNALPNESADRWPL